VREEKRKSEPCPMPASKARFDFETPDEPLRRAALRQIRDLKKFPGAGSRTLDRSLLSASDCCSEACLAADCVLVECDSYLKVPSRPLLGIRRGTELCMRMPASISYRFRGPKGKKSIMRARRSTGEVWGPPPQPQHAPPGVNTACEVNIAPGSTVGPIKIGRDAKPQRTMPTDNSSAETSSEKASRPAPGNANGLTSRRFSKIGVTLLILDLSFALLTSRAPGTHRQPEFTAGCACWLSAGAPDRSWRNALVHHLAAISTPSRLRLETLKLFYVSVFFNSYVWAELAESGCGRGYRYRSNISAKTAITSVVLDRAAALAGVASLVLLTAPFFLYPLGASLPLLVPIFVSMIGLVAIFVAARSSGLPVSWLRFRALSLLQGLGGSVRQVFFKADRVLPTLGVAILGQTALGAAT